MQYLYFSASWCAPCRALAPILDKFSKGLPEGDTLEKIDVDTSPEMAAEHHIKKLPTVIKLDESGNEISRLSGPHPQQAYEQM